MTKHPPEFKEKIIARMMSPTNESIRTLAHETGLGEGTLRQWRKQGEL